MNEPKDKQLVGNQAEAAYMLDRDVSVTAGPGAGKTLVLVERYLHILRTRDLQVDQIVAITFTNRAANEMRERLRRRIDQLLEDSPPGEHRRWMRHKRRLDSAIITTIHGFCARLLREFPVEAGIDPQFALLDEHQTAMLEEAVAEEALTGFITSGHDAITRLTVGYGRGPLVEAIIRIYRRIRAQGLALQEVAQQTEQNHSTLEQYHAALHELDERMAQLFLMRRLPEAAEDKRAEAARRWPLLREMLSDVSRSMPLAQYCQAIEEFREAARMRADGNAKTLVQSLDELIWEKKNQGRLPRLWFDFYARDYAGQLIEVVRSIDERLTEEKLKSSALDFDDLQIRAVRLLAEHPEVLRRAANRYRFFLVDEFQDTNGLQRDLLERLAFGGGRRANLFIVGDRKQSIYGFRGADVDVFREMTDLIVNEGGAAIPLDLNFRSQPPLIHLLNHLFARVFASGDADASQLNQLGYVEHEPGTPQREPRDPQPLIELLVDVRPDDGDDERSSRDRDAQQVVRRILLLVNEEERARFQFRDIALLFRAMTEVSAYESRLRREGVPYLTVQGKGFYAREEITDLIQLLRFLDNKTDELALAAVLRSPMCGLSDDVLLALRRGPLIGEPGELLRGYRVRPLLQALRQHEQIDFIDPADRATLERSRLVVDELIERSSRARLAELLRFAVERSEYAAVVAANYDGAQRLANIEKLFVLAERFEQSGAHLIRDFVRFVHDFEEAGGRESEGQIDESADVVRLMSVHQSKGLEFPVVILPELHRKGETRSDWCLLDRHLGLTLAVPDGRGGRVKGEAFDRFSKRARWRERFESMRLLYVAATRARDRLIMSGAAKDLAKLGQEDKWLGWIWNAIAPSDLNETCVAAVGDGVQVQFRVNLLDQPSPDPPADAAPVQAELVSIDLSLPVDRRFPLLEPVLPDRQRAIHRFSVTQLLNYRRCPRQYYFERVIHAPSGEEVAAWNDAEAPEPPANLTATLRGAVIHRFCEKYAEGDGSDERLKESFDEVLRLRAAELGDRVAEIDRERAIRELRPLAENYVSSAVRRRIESARSMTQGGIPGEPPGSPITRHGTLPGVFSERRFRLRRPRGILTGTIDKLLVTREEGGSGLSAEIIDFKTNRFRVASRSPNALSPVRNDQGERTDERGHRRRRRTSDQGQLVFDFEGRVPVEANVFQSEVDSAVSDYQLQMQAYALAVYELMPEVTSVTVTLHFLDPNIEVGLRDELLGKELCAMAIDEASSALIASSDPDSFPVRPADHCRSCSYLELCPAGRRSLADRARSLG